MNDKTDIEENIKILEDMIEKANTEDADMNDVLQTKQIESIKNALLYIEELKNKSKWFKNLCNKNEETAKELQAKANAYDSLVEKMKQKKRYFEQCDELIASSNDNYADGTVIKRFIDTFQELLDTEKEKR